MKRHSDMQQLLFVLPPVDSPVARSDKRTAKIRLLHQSLFEGDAGKRDYFYFRQRIHKYLRGEDFSSLRQVMVDAIGKIPGPGEIYWEFFETRSGSLLGMKLTDPFWEWCRLVCEQMSDEIDIIEKYYR